jgi:hypothetical protein
VNAYLILLQDYPSSKNYHELLLKQSISPDDAAHVTHSLLYLAFMHNDFAIVNKLSCNYLISWFRVYILTLFIISY